jgi:nitroreductase/NAD-dependent dihydropyrimidine dehydrogenase PreA subunit
MPIKKEMNMSLFVIDQKKCKRDGLCVKDCPVQVIAMMDKDAFPSPREDAEEFCIKCGHCVTICPHGALTLSAMSFDACPPLQKDLLPGPETMRQLLRARRSIRQYKKAPVPHDLLEDLIDTARYAPTGSNKQQVYWTVFGDKAEMKRFAAMVIDFIRQNLSGIADEAMIRRMSRIITAWDSGEDRILRGAPNLILVHSPGNLPFAPMDCVIALTYLELYAYTKGLGTCWGGYFTTAANFYKPLTEALRLPAGHQCHGAIMLGYPKYGYQSIPQRNSPLLTLR